MTRYCVYIGFGECPEDGDDAMPFEFSTQAELSAFLLGLQTADGWNYWEEYDTPHRYVVREESGGTWEPVPTGGLQCAN